MAKVMQHAVQCSAAIVLAAALSVQARCESLNQRVLAALNKARADPVAYQDQLRTYRRFFHARTVALPDSNVEVITEEGVGAVDDAIAALSRQARHAPLAAATLLEESATDHVAAQGGDGSIGHVERDGSDPGTRVRRRGGDDHVWEVITYGSETADDVVRQLIVDDGEADRLHRRVVFADNLRYAGVACGPHPEYGTVCVIDLAETSDGTPGRPALAMGGEARRSFAPVMVAAR